MIRIAATADIHCSDDMRGVFARQLTAVSEVADILVVAGDLTTLGERVQARALGRELSGVGIPVVAVLGNHDYHEGEEDAIREELQAAGIRVLEQGTAVLEVRGKRVGIAGMKGFGGGFHGACGSAFGEREMKAFIEHTEILANRLEELLRTLDTDYRIALLHYAPCADTVVGEKPEIYPFLGAYQLGEAADRGGCDAIFHGHAHLGTEAGHTAGGVPVRNVAIPVLKAPYRVYHLEAGEGRATLTTPAQRRPVESPRPKREERHIILQIAEAGESHR